MSPFEDQLVQLDCLQFQHCCSRACSGWCNPHPLMTYAPSRQSANDIRTNIPRDVTVSMLATTIPVDVREA